MAGGGILLGCLVEGVGSGPESLGKNMRALSFSCLCIFFFLLHLFLKHLNFLCISPQEIFISRIICLK